MEDLKMEEARGKVCREVVVEALTPVDAQKVAQAVEKAAVRVEEQDVKDKV
ncbi:unnamed protein product [marine sediment metagenome]|uniref:Uncharacterized protein n=1 Tax=marine sediment metagenome TaxID=412755 RepID=X1SF94_9ZZZZ